MAVRGELKTALKRVEDLQSAISGELDSENSDNVSCPPDDHVAGDDDKHQLCTFHIPMQIVSFAYTKKFLHTTP